MKENRESKSQVNPSKKSSVKINQLLAKAPIRYQLENYSNVSRKQFEKLIPEIIPDFIREDIAFYFNYLNKNRTKKSLKDWEDETGCKDSPNSWKKKNYRPIFSFLYYDRITEGMFLPLLLKKIEGFTGTRTTNISIEEFNKICRWSIVGFKPSINTVDLKILQELSKDPSLVTQALTDRIDHSYATIYNHLQKLKDKLGLRITSRINWGKLGIQRIFLITNKSEHFSHFSEFKTYLDGKAAFLWGETYHLQFYLLGKEKLDEFKNRYDKLDDKKRNEIKFYEFRSTPIATYNFDLFDLTEQRWEFDFASAFLEPNKLVDKIKDSTIENLFLDEFPPKEKYILTELEIKVLEGLIGSYELTQKELANQLNIHAPNLSVIKNKLHDDDIVHPALFINTFLPLNLVLWCTAKEKEIIETLVHLLQKIPFANISPVTSPQERDQYQLICFLWLDDVLYYSLLTFLMEMLNDKHLSDFRLGIATDSYFGMVKISEIFN